MGEWGGGGSEDLGESGNEGWGGESGGGWGGRRGRDHRRCLVHMLRKISVNLSEKQGGALMFPGPGDTPREPAAEPRGDGMSPEGIPQL